MLNAFFWGFAATFSLAIGGLIAILFKIGKRQLGLIMAFGAGVLFSAVAYELVFKSVKATNGSGASLFGILTGAIFFFLIDLLIGKIGAGSRKKIGGVHESNIAVPIVLATILDGIPETLCIGMSLLSGGEVGIGMLVAVFISNLPEAIAGTAGMVAGKWSNQKILMLWILIAVVCAFASLAGYTLLGNAGAETVSFIQSFAAGAILVMLSNTMIPEAYEHGGKLAGIITVLGFALAVSMVVFETVPHA
jgi:ZIP family zinc transporter